MSRHCVPRGIAAYALGLGLAAGAGAAWGQAVVADTFTSVMAAAMAQMDRDMMGPATGDPDRDFATMMIPHHQGAVDMAEAELRFGRTRCCDASPRGSSSSSGRRSP